jgi:hypothetical protein
MDRPPPAPPPHGANPNTTDGDTRYRKSTDLPDGNYDIFVIPPHSAGSGFLYLPSLQCHRNSFIAGSLSTLLAVVVWITVLPTVKSWFATTVATGGMGILVLALAVGFGGWYWGVTQTESSSGNARGGRGGSGSGSQYTTGPQTFGGGFANGSSTGGAQYSDHQYNTGQPPPHSSPPPPPPPHNQKKTKTEWERAREETKRKEDIRRKMEEYKKKREAEEAEKKRQRDREAMEKEFRERKQQLEKEEKAGKENAAREAAKKEAAARFTAAKDAAAKRFAAAARASPASAPSAAPPRTPSPKKPPQPTAKTATEDDAYSFRPYDRPRRPYDHSAPSVYSESSYAPSQSTTRTTPPPSNRGPYFTKDPDKVIIRGVYTFTNAFQKTPVAQLVSGQGSVTDGLVLRITTEGLFIDDDVRGIAQREWDVKAWTMKLVEVWCPLQSASSFEKPPTKSGGLFWGTSRSTLSNEGIDAFLDDLSKGCKNTCRFSSSVSSGQSGSGINGDRFPMQTAEFRGLHVVRASLRDQEGKKYVFVLQETEGWKVAIGLQRLRRGSQVRALNVAGMPANETKAVLANLGYI